MMAQGAKIRPETAELRLRWPRGGDGRTEGRKDGWKDGRTDVSKFPPVFYRTSALWGRCPKRSVTEERMRGRRRKRRKRRRKRKKREESVTEVTGFQV